MTEYRPNATGTVTPPKDMMQAAKASLSEEGFAELMRETGGASPTPAQLVRIADRERAEAEAQSFEGEVQQEQHAQAAADSIADLSAGDAETIVTAKIPDDAVTTFDATTISDNAIA